MGEWEVHGSTKVYVGIRSLEASRDVDAILIESPVNLSHKKSSPIIDI